MTKLISVLALVCLSLMSVTFGAQLAGAQDMDDPVILALSSRHMTVSINQLEEMAGGEDALVAKLLELRTQESPPFAGIRSEQILLRYAHRDDVKAALESDIQSTQYKGLARTITVHIDKIEDQDARRNLARLALGRAAREADFAPYARNLRNSSDQEVSRLARESLE